VHTAAVLGHLLFLRLQRERELVRDADESILALLALSTDPTSLRERLSALLVRLLLLIAQSKDGDSKAAAAR